MRNPVKVIVILCLIYRKKLIYFKEQVSICHKKKDSTKPSPNKNEWKKSVTLPGLSRKVSNTYDEAYAVSDEYAVYESDNVYEQYIEKYQDYQDFSKFQTKKHSNRSCTTSSCIV